MDTNISSSAVRVGVYLACSHNHARGQLNPAVATITENTTLSKRAVIYALKTLIDSGYISRSTGTSGRGNTCNYKMLKGANNAPNQAEGVSVTKGANNAPIRTRKGANNAPIKRKKGAERVQKTTIKGAKNDNLPPHPPHSVEHGKEHGCSNSHKSETVPKKQTAKKKDLRFDEFWAQCLKKVDKPESRIFWVKNNLDEIADEIIGALMRLNEADYSHRERKHILSPWRWLKRKKWTDEVTHEANHKTPAQSRNDMHKNYCQAIIAGSVDGRIVRTDADTIRRPVDEKSGRGTNGPGHDNGRLGAGVVELFGGGN